LLNRHASIPYKRTAVQRTCSIIARRSQTRAGGQNLWQT
jgi:hypothetical protein